MVTEYLEYTNSRGASVRFGGGSSVGLVSVEGLGDVEASIQQQSSPFQDGTTYIDTKLSARYVGIEFIIREPDYAGVKNRRSEMASVLSPKLGLGLLRYVSGDMEREIYAIAESTPFYPDGDSRGERWQRGSLTFVAPNPYWQDVNPTNIKLEDFVPNFFFPFSFPVTFAKRGDVKTIVNSGHVPSPVTVTFVGESINPQITKKETGEFIRVNRTIPKGYSLVISTGFNDKSVRIIAPDGVVTNAMGYIDLKSSFFSLEIGDNQIEFITDGGQPDVYVEYRNLFLGV